MQGTRAGRRRQGRATVRRRVLAAGAGALVMVGAAVLLLSSGHTGGSLEAATPVVVVAPATPDMAVLSSGLTSSHGTNWVPVPQRRADGSVEVVVVPTSLRAADAQRLAATVADRRLGKATLTTRTVVAVRVDVAAKVRGFASDPVRGQSVPAKVEQVLRDAVPGCGWAVTGKPGHWSVTVVALPATRDVPSTRAALLALAPAVAKAGHTDPARVSVHAVEATP